MSGKRPEISPGPSTLEALPYDTPYLDRSNDVIVQFKQEDIRVQHTWHVKNAYVCKGPAHRVSLSKGAELLKLISFEAFAVRS